MSSGMTGNGQRQEGGEAEQGAEDIKLKTIRWCDCNDGPPSPTQPPPHNGRCSWPDAAVTARRRTAVDAALYVFVYIWLKQSVF